MARRIGGGVMKMTGGIGAMVGGGAVAAAPEPSGLTKVGGWAALIAGTDLLNEGAVQIGRREGGVSGIQEAFGAYGKAVGGDEGERSARFWSGCARNLFAVSGALSSSKTLTTTPYQQLPRKTIEALRDAYRSTFGAKSRTFTSSGTGTNLIRTTTVRGKSVQIKSGHGYNRPHTGPGGVAKDLRTSGLTMDDIENAILSDLEAAQTAGVSIPKPGPNFTGPLERTVTVGGKSITYRVVETPGGQISIPTYFEN